MKKIIKIIVIITLCVNNLSAQNKPEFTRRPKADPSIKNLKVGDKVPDILIAKIIRNDKPSAKISDFKNQLLIIDFWDTFCGSCIEALPKLDSLQNKFGNKVKILPVSYQSEHVIKTFFKNNSLGKSVRLPCVVEDKILGSYFQHLLISHEIWIYKGIVSAITGTDYVTAENIQTILDGKKVNWPVKNDMVTFDSKKTIFTLRDADQYNTKNQFLCYSGITGHREGIDYRQGLVYDTLANGYRSSFYNKSIPLAFSNITFLLQPKKFIPHPDRLVLDVKDKSRYVFQRGKTFPSDWRRENEFCYELVTSKPMAEKERLEYIYSDLQRLLKVRARWEKRPVKCLVMIKNREVNIDSLNAIKKGQKIVISAIPLFYFDQTEQYPPAIDETGIKGRVVIEEYKNLEDLKKQLQLYGLDVIEATREIDVLVITENDYPE